MKTQCSIMASALGSLVESPLKALNGNQTGTIQFWKLAARGGSTTPALCKFSCTQLTGNPLDDVKNYFEYVVSHTWGFTITADGEQYQQTDSIDPATLQALAAVVDINTVIPSSLWGNPPIWNDGIGYTYENPPSSSMPWTTSSGGTWDKTDTRNGIIDALDGVDWAALWANGSSANNNFIYDRAQIAPNESGALPYGPQDKTGLLVAGNLNFGPSLALSGTVGVIGTVFSETLGVSLDRMQIQVRNFHGPAIPYFIYETTSAFTAVNVINNPGNTIRQDASITLTDLGVFYRKVDEGTWTHDLQIIQLPDAAMDGPQEIVAPLGTGVRNGTGIAMVVGKTFEEWMEENLGPSWADYVFA